MDEISWSQSPLVRIIEPADYFRQFLSTSTALPSGMLFTQDSFKSVGGMREDWSFLCDWELFANLLLRAVNHSQFVGYVTAGNYAWRLHEDSTTTTKWRQHFTEHADLMKEWKETLVQNDVLFVSEVDRASFFQRGDVYRKKRLIEDVSKISGSEFRASLPWFRDNLDKSLQRKIIRKSGRKILKRKIRSVLGGVDRKKSNQLNSLEKIEPTTNESWIPEIVITHSMANQALGPAARLWWFLLTIQSICILFESISVEQNVFGLAVLI